MHSASWSSSQEGM